MYHRQIADSFQSTWLLHQLATNAEVIDCVTNSFITDLVVSFLAFSDSLWSLKDYPLTSPIYFVSAMEFHFLRFYHES